MRLAAGLLVALAAVAAGAGSWLLGAVVLAALLAGAATTLPPLADGPAERAASAFTGLALLAVQAGVFGLYVFPEHARLAGCALTLVVTAAGLGGIGLPALAARWTTGLLLAAGLVLVALCVSVPPVGTTTGFGTPDVPGLLVAVLVVLPFLFPVRAQQPGWRVLVLGAAAVLVTFAALYQLGPVRLGLAATSFRDLLAAADADSLQKVLTVVVVLATVPPALATFTEARARVGRGRPGTLLAGLLAAAAALLAGPLPLLVAAGLGTLAEVLLRVRARRYGEVRE